MPRREDIEKFAQVLNSLGDEPAIRAARSETIEEIPLMFIHNPAEVPPGFPGWIIHGHQHNRTPYLNVEERRINVSVENTEYRPVNLIEITQSILSNI